MTSSPPSSALSAAVLPECSALPVSNWPQGLRSLRDLTQHLTTRADDSHAAPVQAPYCYGHHCFQLLPLVCQTQVRYFGLHRIKPRAPPLVRAPVNSFEFQSCDRTPQAECLSRLLRHTNISTRTPSIHRLPLGLPGYLIPFATLAFAPQRQFMASKPPSPPMFFPISTHFTATLGIPLASPLLQSCSFNCIIQLSRTI